MVATGDVKDALEERATRDEVHGDMMKLADGVAPESPYDRVDVEKIIARFREAKLPKYGAEVLAETVAGDGPSAAARELGISERKAHKVLEKVRKHLALATGAALTAALVPMMLMWIRGQVVTSDFEANAREGSGVRSTAQQAPTQRLNTNALAEEALARATADSKACNWDAYTEEMGAIETLDPDGNLAAQVGQLRDRVNQESQEFQAKPGPRLRR